MKKLLVVIDMVNGFVKKGVLADKHINHITKNIINLIKTFKKENNDIISFQDGHSKNSKEFEGFPEHCIIGTEEAELIDELKPYEKYMKKILKNSTSGFVTKEFLKYLEKNKDNLQEIVITGCCTDICILNLALPLKNYCNEYDLNTKIIIPKNCIETYDAPNHNRYEYNDISFKLMKQTGIEVI